MLKITHHQESKNLKAQWATTAHLFVAVSLKRWKRTNGARRVTGALVSGDVIVKSANPFRSSTFSSN